MNKDYFTELVKRHKGESIEDTAISLIKGDYFVTDISQELLAYRHVETEISILVKNGQELTLTLRGHD